MKKKEKKVSFSLFKANSLEEMQQLRLQREKELLNILSIKNEANQSYKAVFKNLFSH